MSTSVLKGRHTSRLWVLPLVVALAPCKPGPTTAEDALRTFFSAVRGGEAKRAWAMLSTETQTALLADAQALAQATGDKPETDPAKLLFDRGELTLLATPESVSVASRPGDSVIMRVSVKDGKGASIHMVREGAEWRVDLIGSLKPLVQVFEETENEDRGGDPELGAHPTGTATPAPAQAGTPKNERPRP